MHRPRASNGALSAFFSSVSPALSGNRPIQHLDARSSTCSNVENECLRIPVQCSVFRLLRLPHWWPFISSLVNITRAVFTSPSPWRTSFPVPGQQCLGASPDLVACAFDGIGLYRADSAGSGGTFVYAKNSSYVDEYDLAAYYSN